jgi:hypothetical protein
MMSKRRSSRGERNGAAKLTEAEALWVKFCGLPQRECGRLAGISQAQVSGIRAGRFWRDLPAKSPDDHTRPSQGDVEAALLHVQAVKA